MVDMVRAGRTALLCGASVWIFTYSISSAADDPALPPAAKTKIEYARDIEPLLQKRCYLCHGAQQQMSGLRLDQKEAALKGGASGVDIQPGNSAGSRLIRLVSGVEAKVMPPIGARLTAAEIGLLRAWIDQGPDWPAQQTSQNPDGRKPGSGLLNSSHWAFQKIERRDPPPVRDRAWPRTAVDQFILARLEAEGIAPSPEAGKLTLLRRVSLDLTGLPPTREEVQEFLRDNRYDAYERVVDRLMD